MTRYILNEIYRVYFRWYILSDIFCLVYFVRVYFIRIYFVQVSFVLAPCRPGPVYVTHRSRNTYAATRGTFPAPAEAVRNREPGRGRPSPQSRRCAGALSRDRPSSSGWPFRERLSQSTMQNERVN